MSSSPHEENAPNAKTDDSSQSRNATEIEKMQNDKTCVVCFKIVDIFSIGECDHPVCYECSTRMRVLCDKHECPICRRMIQKVIFTSEILPYKELDKKNRLGLYDKAARICFTGQRAQNAFNRLLEHRCGKCNAGLFDTASELKDHLRKVHELFYCDICMEHLKIFSFERKAYTREQLAMHRRKGDPDNTSHRGHPLCEYCDQRYLDRDELFRHLRKEHYFCHLCDGFGSNQFYADHNLLRDHFIEEHFLCQEGDCKENIFSAVFPTDIDLTAHKANVHGQTSKHSRMKPVNFSLAPRNQRVNQEGESARNAPRRNVSVNGGDSSSSSASRSFNSASKIIDSQNEQEFPSLGNAPASIRPTVTINMRPSTSGLARTKENFPALGGENSQNRDIFGSSAPSTSSNAMRASTLLFKTPAKAAAPKNPPVKSVNKSKPEPITSQDFPALSTPSTKNKKYVNLESDMVESANAFNMSSVSTKHRPLVQSYESVSSAASTLANQKIKTIQKEEEKPQPSSSQAPLNNSKENFPALGGSSSSVPITKTPQWLNVNGNAKKQQVVSKKLKVAPAPLLPNKNNTTKQVQVEVTKKSKSSEKTKAQPNQSQSKTSSKSENSMKKSGDDENYKKAKEINENNSRDVSNGNWTKKEQKLIDYSHSLQNGLDGASEIPSKPPPGFPAKSSDKSVKMPPGFEPRGAMTYMSPSNALRRNQILVSHFEKSLKPPAVEEFRNVSKLFRGGMCNARAYYEHCEAVLGERFESIFPELLAILPDINKQQELYQTYLNKHKDGLGDLNKYIQVCDRCRQVLKRTDYADHIKQHIEIEKDNKLNKNFPKLSLKN